MRAKLDRISIEECASSVILPGCVFPRLHQESSAQAYASCAEATHHLSIEASSTEFR